MRHALTDQEIAVQLRVLPAVQTPFAPFGDVADCPPEVDCRVLVDGMDRYSHGLRLFRIAHLATQQEVSPLVGPRG